MDFCRCGLQFRENNKVKNKQALKKATIISAFEAFLLNTAN